MKSKLEKRLMIHILRKSIIILSSITIILISVCVICGVFYSSLRSGYHNDIINTLYTTVGKCSNVEYVFIDKPQHFTTSYYIFTVNGQEYRLNGKNSCNLPNTIEQLKNNCLNSEHLTIQYVIGVSGKKHIQSLHLSNGTVYSDLQTVTKNNRANAIYGYIAVPALVSMIVFLVGFYTYVTLTEDKSVSKTIRKLRRKRARQKLFSDKGI